MVSEVWGFSRKLSWKMSSFDPTFLSLSHFPTRWVSEDKLTCQMNGLLQNQIVCFMTTCPTQKYHGLGINRNSNHQASKHSCCVFICIRHQMVLIRVCVECDLNITDFQFNFCTYLAFIPCSKSEAPRSSTHYLTALFLFLIALHWSMWGQ